MTDNSTITWTDGSLDVTRTKAGCAAISESTSTSASFTRSHQMSSTTSELGAILLAVQACPRECKLMIMTDSQASIAKVDLENRAEFTRNILQDPDHEIIDSIHSLLALKNVSLKTSWIKGQQIDLPMRPELKAALPLISVARPKSNSSSSQAFTSCIHTRERPLNTWLELHTIFV